MNLLCATQQALEHGEWAALTKYAREIYSKTGKQMIVATEGLKYKKWDGEKWCDGIFTNQSNITRGYE